MPHRTFFSNLKKYIKTHVWALCIAVVLFLVPFFWFSDGSYELGGDDTRLYYYYPSEWLENRVPYSWNSSDGLSNYYPQIHVHWTTVSILSTVKNVLPVIHIQALTYGTILSLGFIAVYSTTLLFLGSKNSSSSYDVHKLAGILAGLFYVLSPLGHYGWRNPLSDIFGFCLFPLLFYCLLRAVLRKNIVYLAIGSIISVVFASVYNQFPYYIPYIIGFIMFSLLFLIQNPKLIKRWVGYSLIYSLLLLAVNSFWIIPLLYSLFSGTSQLSTSIAESQSLLIALEWQLLNIVDTLMGLVSRNHRATYEILYAGQKFFWLNFLIPIIVFIPLLLASKSRISRAIDQYKTYSALLIVSLVFAFFYTVWITDLGVVVFQYMVNTIPLFGMFKNFYSKFPSAYMYYYSLTLGMSIYMFYTITRNKRIYLYVWSMLVASIVIQGLPFLMGSLLNYSLVKDDQTLMKVTFPSSFQTVMDCISENPRSRVVTLPLGAGGVSLIKGERNDNVYYGSSAVGVFTQHDDINGMLHFGVIDPAIEQEIGESLAIGNYQPIQNLMRNLGVEYILVNNIFNSMSDRYKYRLVWNYETIQNPQMIQNVLDNTNASQVCSSGTFKLYEVNNAQKGLVYIPKTIINTSNTNNAPSLTEVITPDSAIVNDPQENIEIEPNQSQIDSEILYSDRVNTAVRVRNPDNKEVVVVHQEQFHPYWIATVTLPDGSEQRIPSQNHLVANYIMNGWVVSEQLVGNEGEFVITFHFEPQRYYNFGKIISIASLGMISGYLIYYAGDKLFAARK